MMHHPDPPDFLGVQRGRPITPDQQKRIDLTITCHDCAEIPKVAMAGIIDQSGSFAVQTMHNGVRVAADSYCGPWMTRLIELLQGHHEPQEEKAFHLVLEALGQARTMVELGAYWSYYSIWFQQRFPGADLLLVEPDPHFLDIGKFNFALNGAQGEFINAAIGPRDRPPVPFTCESDGQSRPVPVISVDSLLENRGRVDLLLADIQGAEWPMLEGMEKSLAAGKLRVVFISTHHHSISGDFLTHEKVLDWLQARGATILVEHTVEESFSGDGLIVASFDPDIRPGIHLSYCRARHSVFGLPNLELAAVTATLEETAGRLKKALSTAERTDDLKSRIKAAGQQLRTAEQRLQYHSANPLRALKLWWQRLRRKS